MTDPSGLVVVLGFGAAMYWYLFKSWRAGGKSLFWAFVGMMFYGWSVNVPGARDDFWAVSLLATAAAFIRPYFLLEE